MDLLPNDGRNLKPEMDIMKKQQANVDDTDGQTRRAYRVRLPGFVDGEEVGLGDVIKRAAYAAGIEPCGGCQRRAAALNRWVVFSR
jgi:hypothetical protein